ncbi:preprotein translocase subunit SecY [bacterium endosymbiont of Pedicinus badii]|uniref:preprotein translocase subunit SecY n=1 Tax=bacterium endosymbiont of Pedicinus badii TaxID=1719126 RepID=UPI0009B9F084|nr:preprotein translocase subunit SecY [bacterium endosymbiont of Pedicinus badii]OQM34117.1 preprotein translocase subunit SecY [bacterium endosymbiont of Pedicinus badii]
MVQNFYSTILRNKNGIKEIKKRVFFVFLILVVFRIGSYIPIPGIDTTILSKLLEKNKGTIIEMFNMFSGGSFSRASIFSLGIMPYISSSIIVQMLTVVHPSFSEMKKNGESGRKKISLYTRYGALCISILQAIGISFGLPNLPGMQDLIINSSFEFYSTAIISLVCGSVFLMWLGEIASERGIGSGTSIIIFAGIVAGLPQAIANTIEQTRQGELHFFSFLFVCLLVFLTTFLVVFVERGQRKITVHYPKRQQGRKIYNSHCTHLPLKVNMAGVIPAIFASSVVLFPVTLLSWFGNKNIKFLNFITYNLQPGKLFYIFLYTATIIFFCFFYTHLMFNAKETAENLKKSGAFLPGIRPGIQTSIHIEKIMNRLTFLGSIYISLICLVPEFMHNALKVPFYFGGTSLLIVVVVIIDFISQIQTLILSNQYESVFKKANLKSFYKK